MRSILTALEIFLIAILISVSGLAALMSKVAGHLWRHKALVSCCLLVGFLAP